MKNYISEYNKLVPLMNKLSQDNFDIWEKHNGCQGYGFEVIFKKTFISVSIDIDFTSEKVVYYLSHCEKTGNVLFGKTLQSKKVSNLNDIENFIRQVAKSEKEE